MNVLVLSPYAPWPPYGGGTMRIYQLMRGIAQQHTVTCLSFVAQPASIAACAAQIAPATLVAVEGPAPRTLRQRAWQMLVSPLPDMALRNRDDIYTARLTQILDTHHIDVVVAFSIEMAPYLQVARHRGIATVLDEFNAEYIIQKRAALTDARQPRRWHAALYSLVQWGKLQRFEARAIAQATAVTVVSHDDAVMLQHLVPQCVATVIPNGVDTAYFAATDVTAIDYPHPTVVFSGTLDYRPNVDAVRWFVNAVMPLLRQQIPAIDFVVVGRRPTAELQAMHAAGVVQLTGEVADTRPYLCGAAVYVVPMRIGGGVRLKLLEAMSLALPIVSTTLGIEGIDEFPTHCCRLADTPAAMAQAIGDIIMQRTVVSGARDFVVAHYDWQVIIPRFTALLESVVSQRPVGRV
jgi:glycosyltransferase involved in cell wall biosynthesis